MNPDLQNQVELEVRRIFATDIYSIALRRFTFVPAKNMQDKMNSDLATSRRRLLVLIRRILALAVIGASTVGFNPKILGSSASAYRSLTCGEAVYSLFHDNSGLVTGLIVANLFSDVPITVLVYISTGSPDWRRGKSFTVPAGRIIRIPFQARYPEAEVRVGCSY